MPINTDQSTFECRTTEQLDEQPEDTESQDPKSTGNSEEVEDYEDDTVTILLVSQINLILKVSADGNISDLSDKVWIFENCNSLPSETHKLKQNNMNIEKELKPIKDILEDMCKGSANENKVAHETQFKNGQTLKLPPHYLLAVYRYTQFKP